MKTQDRKEAQDVRNKVEELNWIISQMREGLEKIKRAKEEQENERV